jgi:hypothetical protein
MKIYNYQNFYKILYLLILTLLSLSASGAEYWVSKGGNDSNICSSTDTCLTIQRGVSLLSAGDTLNITSGTYTDDGGSSEYKPSGTFCAWLDSSPSSSSVCVDINGTKESPITIQAAPGDEGQVVIDSQNTRIGIHLQNSDYIQIRGLKLINNSTIGIASWGQPSNTVADESRLSIGVVIENNEIDTVRGGNGINASGVGMWGTKDWIVRNNRINNISVSSGTNASCIQTYGTINALVENNHLTNAVYGIYWKDHFVQDIETRTPIFESEIRYNLIHDTTSRGIYIGIRGSSSPESGENYIHHNIIYNYGMAGIAIGTSGAFTVSGPIQIEHNLLDGNGSASAISVDSASSIDISSNILLRNKYAIEFISYADTTKRPFLTSSNLNFFGSGLNIITGMYSSSSKSYSNLTDWQNNAYMDFTSLNSSSVLETESLIGSHETQFLDLSARDYHYVADTFNLKQNNTSIGPYEIGNEVIGLKTGWPTHTSNKSLASPPPGFTGTRVQ